MPPFATGSVPVTPVVSGRPVAFVKVPDDGVPNTPPLTTGEPAEPTLTAKAAATLVPRPATPVEMGKPVALVRVTLVGVPSRGVTNVGLVANTAAPEPVSSVKAPDSCAEVNDPSEVALPEDVTAPVKLAFVVTVPAVRPAAVPVMFVPTRAVGVPSAGVTSVGDVDSTLLPVPVLVVTPVPPDKTGSAAPRVKEVKCVAPSITFVPSQYRIMVLPLGTEIPEPADVLSMTSNPPVLRLRMI